MMNQIWFWIAFNIFITGMLVLDLAVLNRSNKAISIRKSLLMLLIWILLALGFNALVYMMRGETKALEFFTGYVIELSLSIDNLFVFLIVFSYFKVSKDFQHRILFWGIVGAVILRAIFIFSGLALIKYFDWINYVFGAILIYTGIRMFFHDEVNDADPNKNFIIRLFKRMIPVKENYKGDRFFMRDAGKIFATPLFIVLLVIEMTDLLFAVDSIPAVLSISRDPFIVYTSNVFAVLGLRSMFSALTGVMDIFRYLKYGLAVILSFVGVKMIGEHFFHLPVFITLMVILIVLLVSIMISVMMKNSTKRISH